MVRPPVPPMTPPKLVEALVRVRVKPPVVTVPSVPALARVLMLSLSPSVRLPVPTRVTPLELEMVLCVPSLSVRLEPVSTLVEPV